jgi:hypothetical protein
LTRQLVTPGMTSGPAARCRHAPDGMVRDALALVLVNLTSV